MGTNTKSETGEKLDVRFTILLPKSLDEEYKALCKTLDDTPSEHTRGLMIRDLAMLKAKKAK